MLLTAPPPVSPPPLAPRVYPPGAGFEAAGSSAGWLRPSGWFRRSGPTVGLVVAVVVFLRLGVGPALGLLFGFVVLTPLERIFRRHAQPIRRPGLRTDMFHLLFTGFLSTAGAFVAIVAWFVVLLPITFGGRHDALALLPPPVAAVVAFVLFEVLGYVAHRALHEVPAFWRFHAVHHSSRNLDWLSGARGHPVEGLIGGAIIAPPLLLLGVEATTLGALTVLVNLWGVLLHANIGWRFAWMDGWWGTPELHHWHHSDHPEARNKNYAAFLPMIDRWAGTYWQPRDRRPVLYGIAAAMPDGWWAQMLHPFRTDAGRLALVHRADAAREPMAPPLPFSADVDDRTLVAGVADGDRRALEVLYRRHAGWLTTRLQGRCAERELVDTALQDTFVAVWKGAASFRGDGDVGAWLWGIAVRRLIDQVRKRRPAPLDPARFGAAGARGSSTGWPVGEGGGQAGGAPTAAGSAAGSGWPPPDAMAGASAEEVLFAHGIGGELAVALARLEPELRAVMLATAVDGLSTKEVATLLGIPQGTVKTRLMRARARLQEGLG